MKKILAVIIMVGCSFLCAHESEALIIGPARQEARLPAGEVAGINYYVQNDTQEPVRVTVEPENWFEGAYDYTGIDIKDWIKVDSREFDLKPKEIKKLLVTIKIPKKASGELVAQLFFSAAAIDAAANNGKGVRSRLGAVLYIAIKGTERAVATIKDVSISNFTAEDKKQVNFEVVLSNEGNVHIRPEGGYLMIMDSKNRQIAKLQPVLGQGVIPGQKYSFTAHWDDPKAVEGKYKAWAVLEYGKMYGREKKAEFKKEFEIDKLGRVISR